MNHLRYPVLFRLDITANPDHLGRLVNNAKENYTAACISKSGDGSEKTCAFLIRDFSLKFDGFTLSSKDKPLNLTGNVGWLYLKVFSNSRSITAKVDVAIVKPAIASRENCS